MTKKETTLYTHDVLDEFLDPCADILPFFRSYEQIDGLDVRAGSQELLDEHLADPRRHDQESFVCLGRQGVDRERWVVVHHP